MRDETGPATYNAKEKVAKIWFRGVHLSTTVIEPRSPSKGDASAVVAKFQHEGTTLEAPVLGCWWGLFNESAKEKEETKPMHLPQMPLTLKRQKKVV